MSVFGLKLLMIVIVKALISLYNIDLLSIHEAWNAKEPRVVENAGSSGPFYFCTICLLKKTSTMAAASPIHSKFMTDRVKLWPFRKLMTSSRNI